jgi:acetyltransferase-like isoleucine patch superfamily enzyme
MWPLARGLYYVLYFRLFRRNVRIALPFLAHTSVAITGPGRVAIGPWCSVHQNTFRGLSIATLSPDATVTLGAHCSLGGLTIRCRHSVAVGDYSRSAFCLIQDEPFWSSSAPSPPGAKTRPSAGPIQIGRNAWLGGSSIVLGGATIGDDSVVGWGSCCANGVVPAASLAVGNPAGRPLSIASVLALRRRP